MKGPPAECPSPVYILQGYIRAEACSALLAAVEYTKVENAAEIVAGGGPLEVHARERRQDEQEPFPPAKAISASAHETK